MLNKNYKKTNSETDKDTRHRYKPTHPLRKYSTTRMKLRPKSFLKIYSRHQSDNVLTGPLVPSNYTSNNNKSNHFSDSVFKKIDYDFLSSVSQGGDNRRDMEYQTEKRTLSDQSNQRQPKKSIFTHYSKNRHRRENSSGGKTNYEISEIVDNVNGFFGNDKKTQGDPFEIDRKFRKFYFFMFAFFNIVYSSVVVRVVT